MSDSNQSFLKSVPLGLDDKLKFVGPKEIHHEPYYKLSWPR